MINAISSALAGLSTASKQVTESANKIATYGTEQGKDVNFTEEAVKLSLSKAAQKANLITLETVNELTDELLHVFDERI